MRRRWERAAPIVLALALGAPAVAQEEEGPAAEIERAEGYACKGRYSEARQVYARLAKKHPDTPEGKQAAERSAPSAFLGSCPIIGHGDSANRVDVVLMGDGYELDHLRAFQKLAEDVPPMFERVEPFREYWSYFNFLNAVCLSADAGVDGFGREYDTLLGGRTLGTDAGHVGVDHERVTGVLSQVPNSDGLAIVFVKLGVLGTGGGGHAVIGGRDAKTAVHEWGHAFGGLGDEYDTRTHDRGKVSGSVNVATSEDARQAPWAHWIEAKHPSVGMYEGAAGQVRGAWRPTASGCIMQTGGEFCPVCREALVLRIYSIVDPIDATEPPAPPAGVREPIVLAEEPIELRVRALKPAEHDLEVRWWVEPEERFPSTEGGNGPGAGRVPAGASPPRRIGERTTGSRRGAEDRRARGPLPPIEGKPYREQMTDQDGVYELDLKRSDLEPGKYKVTCRVLDTTKLRGERFPWVLRDEFGVLESERVWWVEVR